MANTPDPIEEAYARREAFRAKTFRMMLHIAFIFGVPAAIAFFAGNELDTRFSQDRKTWLFVLLGIAFISSWAMVIRMYKKISAEGKAIDIAMSKAKKTVKEQVLKSDETDSSISN